MSRFEPATVGGGRRSDSNVPLLISPVHVDEAPPFDVNSFIWRTLTPPPPPPHVRPYTAAHHHRHHRQLLAGGEHQQLQPLSAASSASTLRPICRICHLASEKASDPLIAPCRCSGTMQFVHRSCLVHWLEIADRKMYPSAKCELCGYEYKVGSCLCHCRSFRLPHCSKVDAILHLSFIIVVVVMFGCGILSFLSLSRDPYGLGGSRGSHEFGRDDVVVIVCSVLFFCAFFVAVFTQYRAEASICRLLFRCCTTNSNWRIDNYDQQRDEQLQSNVTLTMAC